MLEQDSSVLTCFPFFLVLFVSTTLFRTNMPIVSLTDSFVAQLKYTFSVPYNQSSHFTTFSKLQLGNSRAVHENVLNNIVKFYPSLLPSRRAVKGGRKFEILTG